MDQDEPLLSMIAHTMVEETRVALVRAALAHLGAKEMKRSGHPLSDDAVRRELRALLKDAADRAYEKHREAVIERVVDEIMEGATKRISRT